jgi:CheY-like chemotaxis protein
MNATARLIALHALRNYLVGDLELTPARRGRGAHRVRWPARSRRPWPRGTWPGRTSTGSSARCAAPRSERTMPKILVIDDDTIVRPSIIHLLEDEGYQVSSANDGKRGMVMFRSGQPDLVTTDIIMPEQECMQTIAEILKAVPNAKIIAISGIGRVGNVDFLKMAKSLGATDTVAKPFDHEELLSHVKTSLAGARAMPHRDMP